jgi:hypothetical protein
MSQLEGSPRSSAQKSPSVVGHPAISVSFGQEQEPVEERELEEQCYASEKQPIQSRLR